MELCCEVVNMVVDEMDFDIEAALCMLYACKTPLLLRLTSYSPHPTHSAAEVAHDTLNI